jgi:hypothetical protein
LHHPDLQLRALQLRGLQLRDLQHQVACITCGSTADEKWLGTIAAEQALAGGITLSDTVSETATGCASTSIAAGFRRSW